MLLKINLFYFWNLLIAHYECPLKLCLSEDIAHSIMRSCSSYHTRHPLHHLWQTTEVIPKWNTIKCDWVAGTVRMNQPKKTRSKWPHERMRTHGMLSFLDIVANNAFVAVAVHSGRNVYLFIILLIFFFLKFFRFFAHWAFFYLWNAI